MTGNGGNGGDGGLGVPDLRDGHAGSGGRGGNGGGLYVARRGPVDLSLNYFVRNATGAGGRGGLSPAPDIPDGSDGNRGGGGAINRENLTTQVTLSQVYFTDNDPDNCRDIPGC
ncbi:hypothetical protein [Saccharothrix algeriensis]|uniref:Uncharacterized protein n=1 Tax=Saccharothrix algeriensis TaxID=173560 RepID=A0A8T8HX86_9PSEU|nr:hypothetical protein [Saccharothrix algeriensis]MBM7814830.1 hypothetical protein [Saccharothrix algeriensis]QTR03106.1 hypothetical protein J7S33_29755 [Saccharothrix algeriensis]